MVASYSSAAPSSWRPTARTLGALFAGSAVMFASTVLNGDSLLPAGDEAGSITQPLANPTGIGLNPSGSISAPGQHIVGTPGTDPQRRSSQWSSSPGDLPAWRAPVLQPPQQGSQASATPAEVAYKGSGASGGSAARPVAPGQPAGNAGRPASQTANPRHNGPFNGLLNSVFHVAKALPR